MPEVIYSYSRYKKTVEKLQAWSDQRCIEALTPKTTFTKAQVKANKSIGWYLAGQTIIQVVSVKTGEIRVVGRLTPNERKAE